MRWFFILAIAACSTPSSPCPPSPPANGEACTRDESLSGLACEYGGTANTTCTTGAFCSYGSQPAAQPFWTVDDPDPTCGMRAASCPAAFGDGEGTSCATALPDCEYDEGVCGCLSCEANGGFGGFWHCRRWTDVAAGCPVPRPRLGETCSDDGLRCDYAQCCGGPSLGARMICKAGYWSGYVDTACSCAIPVCP